jgi:hypothetical protein
VSDHAADIASDASKRRLRSNRKIGVASHNLERGVEMQPALAELGKDEAAICVGKNSVGAINPG